MSLAIESQKNPLFERGEVAVQTAIPETSCGIDLSTALTLEPCHGAEGGFSPAEPSVDFGQPLQDWFEMALQAETPVRGPSRASWGEDDDESEDDLPEDDADEEEADPFEDFDEDDFDDDFEEELDDEYEIEPADDGLVTDADLDEESIDDEEVDEEDIAPDAEDLD